VPTVAATPESVERAAAVLRAGGLVAFPTETVYGLGADATNGRAVARVFEVKRRPHFDPLIVHVCDDAMLAEVVTGVPPTARRLIDRFWPGPLTLVLTASPRVASLVTAGLSTVAVRRPSHPVALDLIRRAGVPVAAPSANPFGSLSPTRADHVARMLGEHVDLVLDAGPALHGVESTILAVDGPPVLLRHGAIPVEELEQVLGPIGEPPADSATPLAPGRAGRHYSPRTPIRLVDPTAVASSDRAGAGLLAFRAEAPGYAVAEVLSPNGDLREAAARLFDALHRLDAAGVIRIDAEPVPETRLGRAIMERLRRAER
jgi:L-threonylcarbamoyladenylate synthase